MAARKDIAPGTVFSRLTTLAYAGKIGIHHQYTMRCECGEVVNRPGTELRAGRYRSCGCYRLMYKRTSRITHGLAKHPLYQTWDLMMRRCHNEQNHNYKNYGARGIFVCDRWKDVASFIEDMPPRPSDKHQLDRIDNNKGYSPENVRWATPKENSRNRRSSLFVEYEGARRLLVEVADGIGISADTLRLRLRRAPETMFVKGRVPPRSLGVKKVVPNTSDQDAP